MSRVYPFTMAEAEEILRELGEPVKIQRTPDPVTIGAIPEWRLYDLAEFADLAVEPLRWIAEGLIPEGGIGFLSGAPKDGKSLLALDLVVHLAHGRPWLGRYATSSAATLYVAREDPLRRLKERLLEINESYGYPPLPPGKAQFLVRERFSLMSANHQEWLAARVKELGIGLLVLDVLNRMIPELDELSAADMARMVSVLESMNRDLGVTILCLDHTRKPQGINTRRNRQEPNPFDLKGSIAKYGAADFMLCLARTEQDGRLQLYCENKDTDRRPHFLLDIAPKDSGLPKFTWAGDVEALAQGARKHGDQNRRAVWDAMTPGEWMSASELAQKLELGERTVRRHLADLADAGEVDEVGDGRWRRYSRPLGR